MITVHADFDCLDQDGYLVADVQLADSTQIPIGDPILVQDIAGPEKHLAVVRSIGKYGEGSLVLTVDWDDDWQTAQPHAVSLSNTTSVSFVRTRFRASENGMDTRTLELTAR